jgi:dimethylglycine dehydrogenase
MVGLELPISRWSTSTHHRGDPRGRGVNAATNKEMLQHRRLRGRDVSPPGGQGLLLGTYERACQPWSARETPWNFGHELLPTDLDRIAPIAEVGFKHYPASTDAGSRGDQRPVHLRAGRQPAGRPGAGPDAISGSPAG